MSPMQERSTEIGLGELLNLETSVLRALCLTINAAGSEIKYKILDMLSEDDFYFPINKAVFHVLQEMERKGDYVVYTSLEESLRKTKVDLPEDFFVEDLFRGDLPSLDELTETLGRLKERAQKGINPVPDARPTTKEPSAEETSSPDVHSRAEEVSAPEVLSPKARSSPELTPPPRPAASPKSKSLSSSDVGPRLVATPQKRAASDSAVTRVSPPEAKKKQADAERVARERLLSKSGTPPRRSASSLLSSEGEEWDNYLQDLASKQGKAFDTGFAGLDQGLGGLGPGLMLLVDENHDRLCGFLKQLTDQVAELSKLPCLYLSFDYSKDDLRVRTLSRLSGVPARDIEKGRLKKDSAEWNKVEQCGRQAAAWLKRVYVVEADPQTGIGMVREMCQRLVESSGASTCMVVIDTLEGFGRGSESLRTAIGDLKKLSDSLDVLVVAGAISTALLSDRSAHLTAVLRRGDGSPVELEVLRAGETKSSLIRLDYQSPICRFREITK